jgi:hypothetical protein
MISMMRYLEDFGGQIVSTVAVLQVEHVVTLSLRILIQSHHVAMVHDCLDGTLLLGELSGQRGEQFIFLNNFLYHIL